MYNYNYNYNYIQGVKKKFNIYIYMWSLSKGILNYELLLLHSEVIKVFSDENKIKGKDLKKIIDEIDIFLCATRMWDKVQARDDESSICSFILHQLRQLARQWITIRVSDRKCMHAQIGSYIFLLRLIGYFTWSIWSISTKPIVCVVARRWGHSICIWRSSMI